MTYQINTRWSGSESMPSVDRMREILTELDAGEDAEHPSVSLVHDSEWSISAFPDGLVIWENAEEDVACHMLHVSRTKVLELWTLLAEGRIDTILGEPWILGYF